MFPLLTVIMTMASAVLGAQGDDQDRTRLQGAWYTVAEENDGAFTTDFGELPELGFQGDTFLAYGRPSGRYRLGAGKGKSPRTIDLLVEAGPGAGKTELGIYRFEGASLIICWSHNGAPRPDTLTVPKGSRRRLTTYERAPRYRNPRSAGDREHLQGDWRAQDQDRLTFAGDTRFQWGQAMGRYSNDASQEPKTIDFIYDSGKTELGIYKFEGTLSRKVLVLVVGTSRPRDFTMPEGSNQRLIIYKQNPIIYKQSP